MRSNAARLSCVRPAEQQDVPAIVDLFDRAFTKHGWRSESVRLAYFREILFQSPWRDPEIASLVLEVNGSVAGFYGIVPRTMLFRGRCLRVAVCCNFIVDPDVADALLVLELLKALLAGPQDLTLADGATFRAQQIWTRIGGRAPLVYCLHWLRPLRPGRYALHVLRHRQLVPRALTFAARPLAGLGDSLAARLRPNRFLGASSQLSLEPLQAASIAADLATLAADKALLPLYDEDSFAWLLNQVARKPLGTLRARRVLDHGRLLGWFVYFVSTDIASEVVQLVAAPGAYERVLEALLADAWHNGAVAVAGRLDPDGAQPLSRRHCWMRWQEPATLVHSRDPEIAAAIEGGRALLTRLDGEWWMRFASG